MRDSTTNLPTKTVTEAFRETLSDIWRGFRRRLVMFVVFLLMISILQPVVQLVIAEELHISMRLSEQVALATGGIYLAIYLLGELAHAVVVTRKHKDAIVIGCLLVGALFDSLAAVFGLILVANIASEAYYYWRTDNRLKEHRHVG